MSGSIQTSLLQSWFPQEAGQEAPSDRAGSHHNLAKFGTFTDSKSAPIHRWFQYPAGFSYKAVEYALDEHGIRQGHVVYDPFAGTGTTLVVCKSRGIESIGVEAHPFIVQIARTKLKWEYDHSRLRECAFDFAGFLRNGFTEDADVSSLPELVRKCYSEGNLKRLVFIRDAIEDRIPAEYRDVFRMALVGTLRLASAAATGWPYIAPKKKIAEKDGIETFIKQLNVCIGDLSLMPRQYRATRADLIEGDCRKTEIEDESANFAFTSPPYLNNYDYADRTRLEMYFLGYASSWGDITEKVRNRLIMAATTQVVRGGYNVQSILSDDVKRANPYVTMELQKKVSELARVRQAKGGKKSYDIMVGQYFNDMTLSLKDTFRVLRKGAKYLLILGDSAPYGVHIPTERYLGEIGAGIGFRDFNIIGLRSRGGKWKHNPQRHTVPLRESILVLAK